LILNTFFTIEFEIDKRFGDILLRPWIRQYRHFDSSGQKRMSAGASSPSAQQLGRAMFKIDPIRPV
jgi:hypothetical protein